MTYRVPNPRRVLVTFLVDGGSKFASKFDQPELLLTGIGGALGNLAAMFCFAVNIFQQRQQFVFKRDVVVRTSQPSLRPKLLETDPATGTHPLIEFIQIFAGFRFCPGRHIFSRSGGGLAEIVLGTRFTQVQSLNFTLPKFGDVQDGGFRAATALFHDDCANRFNDTGSI